MGRKILLRLRAALRPTIGALVVYFAERALNLIVIDPRVLFVLLVILILLGIAALSVSEDVDAKRNEVQSRIRGLRNTLEKYLEELESNIRTLVALLGDDDEGESGLYQTLLDSSAHPKAMILDIFRVLDFMETRVPEAYVDDLRELKTDLKEAETEKLNAIRQRLTTLDDMIGKDANFIERRKRIALSDEEKPVSSSGKTAGTQDDNSQKLTPKQ